MAKFPLEIEYLILETLDENLDKRKIILSGLICKAWLHFSRSRIFTDIRLDKPNIKSFFDIAQNSLLSIFDFIRTLSLVAFSNAPLLSDCFADFRRLGLCPGIEHLTLELYDSDLEKHSAFLGTVLPSILSLEISGYYLKFPSFTLDAISSFPMLESLTMHAVPNNFFANYTIPTYRFLEALETMDIDSDEDNFLQVLTSLNAIPIFSSLSVGWGWMSDESS
ncbi:hypothetical protein DFH09DRAFT_1180245 [Mycena vulgaris]|nr:hypothetical protein DFH09DRAFT_1180245 [Mycena vulgaris]